MKQSNQKGTYIIIKINKYNNKHTQQQEYLIYNIKQKYTKLRTINTMIRNRTKRI
jgi:hypothetical protein